MMQCNRTYTQAVRAAHVTLSWWWLLSTLDASCKFWLKTFCGHNTNAKRNAHQDKVSISKAHFKFTKEPDVGAIWESNPKAASSGGTAWGSLSSKVSTGLLSDSTPDFPHQTFANMHILYMILVCVLQICIAAPQMVGLVFWMEILQLVLEILDLGFLSRESQVYVLCRNAFISSTSQAYNIKTQCQSSFSSRMWHCWHSIKTQIS